jgi:transcriptional repressor NF-X1
MVIYPPSPCNTPPPVCNFPCLRPRACGHVNLNSHYCHPADTACPPCMTFTSRECICGKETLKNIPCSRQALPSCGKICQKLIPDCDHLCQRTCHSDECSNDHHPCLSQCLQIRSCGHKCQYKCHGKICSEDNICKQSEMVSCKCGRIKKSVVCCATKAQPSLIQQTILVCDEICAKEQRKHLMAKAFKIDTSETSSLLLQSFSGWPENLVKNALSFMTV